MMRLESDKDITSCVCICNVVAGLEGSFDAL